MQKYFCNPCGYTYDPEKGDPEHGIAPGTKFEDLPDDWCCPLCGVNKSMFQNAKRLSHESAATFFPQSYPINASSCFLKKSK